MTTVKNLIKNSNDFDKYGEIFLRITKKLIWDLWIKKSEVKGWKISTYYEKDLYCIIAYKVPSIFLNIKTKEVFYLYENKNKIIIYKGENMKNSAPVMPHMRPIPINTKGKPWYKSWLIWLKTTRKWEIIEDWYFYIEYLNLFIFIPKGFIFDGASIPKLLRTFFSPVGILLLPGLLHDYGYRYGYLVTKDISRYQINVVLENFTRKDWDNLFTKVSEQVNDFNILNKFPRLGLWVGAGFTWRAHRKRNLSDPMFIEARRGFEGPVIESPEEELE